MRYSAILIQDEDDFDFITKMPIRCQNALTDVAYNVSRYCDDLLRVDRVGRDYNNTEIHFRMLAKSGMNGTMRIVSIMNSIFEYSPESLEPFAELTTMGFKIRCCHKTHYNKKGGTYA